MTGFIEKLGLSAVLIYFLVLILAISGYVMNIMEIISSWGNGVTAMFLTRLVGVIVPALGAIVGWF